MSYITQKTIDLLLDNIEFCGFTVNRNEVIDVEAVEVTDEETDNNQTDNKE